MSATALQKLTIDLALHQIEALDINIVMVIGDEKMHALLTQKLSSQKHRKVVKIPSSGGATDSAGGNFGRKTEALKNYFFYPSIFFQQICLVFL